ncbi:MAG: hypothetical protein DCC65_11865 [Planctomycetota bacterium]|nr:MAG: hypothetical protein DCC65_11865 [Planctomycetota bacterium]
MSTTARSGLLFAWVSTLLVGVGLECPGVAPQVIPTPGTGVVTLRIQNESGFRARVESEFVLENLEVRKTLRMLDAIGLESEAMLLPTRTHFLSVVAYVADDSAIPPSALLKPGDVLAQASFEWNVDFKDGDTLLFVIPAPDDSGGQIIDCNSNGVSDLLDIQSETSADCNTNGIPDECDIAGQPDLDCDENGTLDACEPGNESLFDCNENGVFDACDIRNGTSLDCNANGVPDECDLWSEGSYDCNDNGKPDECDIASGFSEDCQSNGIPDECDIAYGESDDCNSNGIPDECDVEHDADVLPRGTEGALLFPVDETHQLAMLPTDDGSSAQIDLGFGFQLYGVTHHSVYINNNGNISFGAAFPQFTSTGFPVQNFPMVAPFWADVDTRGELGRVVYKLTEHALIVTWESVGYFNQKGDKRNTFQVAISDGDDPVIGMGNNVAFSYANMQWTTGDASGGAGGFGGVPATVGANAGDNQNFFQIGRFSQPGDAYDGPLGAADGIDFLDDQVIRFSTAGGTTNVAPIATGLPPDGVLRVNPRNGESVDLLIQFLSPEAGQTTTLTVQDVGGAGVHGLTFENTPGNTATVRFLWTPDCNDQGLFQFVMTARDDFITPAESVSSFQILVTCFSEDCNGNQIPDECETDCDGNGRPDDCDMALCEGRPGCGDCNENGVMDSCDIDSGYSDDENENLIPDDCEPEQGFPRIGDHGSIKITVPLTRVDVGPVIPLDDFPNGVTIGPGVRARIGSDAACPDPDAGPSTDGQSGQSPYLAVRTVCGSAGISVIFDETVAGQLPVWSTIAGVQSSSPFLVEAFNDAGECVACGSSAVFASSPQSDQPETLALSVQVNAGISRIHIRRDSIGDLLVTAPDLLHD